jgi:hypothetical protein
VALAVLGVVLIFLINALWHIINAVFSPEVFPLDTSIFTGYISRERMAREHPIELARIEEGLPTEPPAAGSDNPAGLPVVTLGTSE